VPYSDKPPGYVIPDSPAWRRRAKLQDWPELDDEFDGMTPWEYCHSYEPTKHMSSAALNVIDKRHPDCLPCANLNPSGVRNHNWCYRCPAGMMHASLHIYDAALDRDRKLLLG